MNTYCRIAVLAALIISLSAIRIGAQNVQLHYDFGRGCATSTVEISRELCFWQDSKLNWLSFNGFFDFWREMRPWLYVRQSRIRKLQETYPYDAHSGDTFHSEIYIH